MAHEGSATSFMLQTLPGGNYEIFFCYIFINVLFAIQRLHKYISYAEGLSRDTHSTQSVKWKDVY